MPKEYKAIVTIDILVSNFSDEYSSLASQSTEYKLGSPDKAIKLTSQLHQIADELGDRIKQ